MNHTSFCSPAPREVQDALRFKILLIEDNDQAAELMITLLRRLGSENVQRAASVSEALQTLQFKSPDVVLCDFNLGPLTGLDFLFQIRRSDDPAIYKLPVLMLTGHTERELVMRMRDAGATDVIAKPVSPKLLKERLAAAVADPRPFVRSEAYVGPDRRWRPDAEWLGPERRSAGVAEAPDRE